MIDKYNARLDRVGQLLVNLSSLIENLLSLIRDIRNTLGQSKQRIYNNLEQVKEVIGGNGITGTESTIAAIESALEAGDKAIDEAEATLEGVQAAVECDQDYCSYTSEDIACGEIPTPEDETCNEPGIVDTTDCSYCSYTNASVNEWSETCSVCDHGDCNVDISCGEDFPVSGVDGCTHTSTVDGSCGQVHTFDENCTESLCIFDVGDPPSDCIFTCSHSSDCHELPMPEGCTYTCEDHDSCSYSGDDCSYSSSCGQHDSCNQYDCDQYDCGEPCGETCHMTDDGGGSEGDCSEGSCGEGDCSEDGPCNQYDCSEYDCGEPCGESCGLL
jgi:hypothetical protein